MCEDRLHLTAALIGYLRESTMRGILKAELETGNFSCSHTLKTVLYLSMVACPIFQWIDLKILAGWWPVLDNVKEKGILKGQIMGGKKE